MAVEQSDIIFMEQFAALRRQSDAAAATQQSISQGAATYLNLLDRVMLNQITDISFTEAAAMREATGGESRAAGIAKAMDLAKEVLAPIPPK